jgi:hypothetical protein
MVLKRGNSRHEINQIHTDHYENSYRRAKSPGLYGCKKQPMIENPQPAWLPLLLLALPGIVFAACALNETVFPREDRPLCTIPAIAMVLALLPTHVLALTLGSLRMRLAVAWSVVGVVGYAWIATNWREFFATLLNERAGWTRKLGIALAATLPIVLPTILLNFHDEVTSTFTKR